MIRSICAILCLGISPAAATVIEYSLQNSSPTALLTKTTFFNTGQPALVEETPMVGFDQINDNLRSAASNYTIRIDDALLPFDLAGATLNARDYGTSSLVGADGQSVSWFSGDVPIDPDWLLEIYHVVPIQHSVFHFDFNREISSWNIFADFDGESVEVTPDSVRNTLFGGFLPSDINRITYNVSGLDFTFLRTPAGSFPNPQATQVPLPAGLTSLIGALFGLAFLSRRKTA